MLSVHARLSPGRIGASDLRSMSLATSNECACRLTNTLLGRSRKNFNSDHCVRTLARSHPSFTSLVATHHIMMSELPAAARVRHRLDRATKRYRRMQRAKSSLGCPICNRWRLGMTPNANGGFRLKFSETAATLLCGFEVEAHENRASKCVSACNGLPDAFRRSEPLASRNCNGTHDRHNSGGHRVVF